MRLPLAIIRLDFLGAENLLEETVLENVERLHGGEQFAPVNVRFDGAFSFLGGK